MSARAGVALAVGVLALWAGSRLLWGHVIRAPLAPNHHADFDFTAPPCAPAARVPGPGVSMRYLGAGGLAIEWQGKLFLTGPFFSNPSLGRVMFGNLRWDEEEINAGLQDLPLDKAVAILIGHSHYDHVADLPIVAPRAAAAKLLVNTSAYNMLASYPELQSRALAYDRGTAAWIEVDPDVHGRGLFRILALPSEHAPHVDHYLWGGGEVRTPWTGTWAGRPLRDFKEGGTHAFLIDLMTPDRGAVAFRLYYQDAASGRGYGPVPVAEATHRVDLAALCMASYKMADDAPGWLLRAVEPRHVLVTHYEDFLRDRRLPLRFVGLLTNGAANSYLEETRQILDRLAPPLGPPLDTVCGPAAPEYTMPLPGEWLRFAAPGL